VKKNILPPNEDGHRLWLRYLKIGDQTRLSQYRRMVKNVTILETGAVYRIIKYELHLALPAMLDTKVPIRRTKPAGNAVVIGTVENLKKINIEVPPEDNLKLGEEGFLIRRIQHGRTKWTEITANSESALVWGVFHFLRFLQTQQDIREINVINTPRIRRRLLAHWDNLDGSIERGYAGRSLWQWDRLSEKMDKRYRDYARACASIGINGVILNNVNSQAESLSTGYLEKTAAIAGVLRPYGIRVYLSAAFNSPIQLGGLTNSDPRDSVVARWWR